MCLGSKSCSSLISALVVVAIAVECLCCIWHVDHQEPECHALQMTALHDCHDCQDCGHCESHSHQVPRDQRKAGGIEYPPVSLVGSPTSWGESEKDAFPRTVTRLLPPRSSILLTLQTTVLLI